MQDGTEHVGCMIRGFMAASGVQPKALSAVSGVDAATISRELNGRKAINAFRAFQYGVATGEIMARKRDAEGTG